MRVRSVICSVGRSGYMHRDLMAMKGGAKQDGFIFHGKPLSPGFKKIVEPGTIVSVMLELEDGQIAFGDCADVILAGVAGRDPAFNGEEHIDYLRSEIAPLLKGRDVAKFRANAGEFDQHRRGGKPMHTAVRYGLTQALLHATALSHKKTMAEVIAREYGSTISKTPIPILASGHKDDPLQLDRTILKRAELLPHASFTMVKDHVGLEGEKLLAFAANVVEAHQGDRRRRLQAAHPSRRLRHARRAVRHEAGAARGLPGPPGAGGAALRPAGRIADHRQDPGRADRRLQEAARASCVDKGIAVGLIADEWCNTLEDIKLFADVSASDYVQIKTPDLGGINNTIEAVLYCRSKKHGLEPRRHGQRDRSLRAHLHAHRPCLLGRTSCCPSPASASTRR